MQPNDPIKQALDLALEALDRCEDYFDQRQDADCDQDGFIPNEEMRLLSQVTRALVAVTKARDSINV